MNRSAYILGGLGFLVTGSVLAGDSHCTKQEDTVFSCTINQKIVSVCASKNLSPSTGYLQYRFGNKGSPELVFPSLTDLPKKYTQAKTLMFSGGGGAYIRFIKDQFSYVVYTAIGKGWGTKDGVAVEKNKKISSNFKCKDVPTSMLNADFFKKAGIPEDPDEFELP